MNILEGISASPGLVIGSVLLHIDEVPSIPQYAVQPEQVAAEYNRFYEALSKSISEIELLRSAKAQGRQSAEHLLLNTHLMMLQDPEFADRVRQELSTSLLNVEWVLNKIMKDLIAKLSKAKDEYLRERTADLHDVSKRVLNHLMCQVRSTLDRLTGPILLVCRDLLPSDAIGMDKANVLGIAMDGGGKTSHTAILARSFGIPAVLGLSEITQEVRTGDKLIIDGHRGRVVINPDAATIRQYQAWGDGQKARSIQLESLISLPAQTLDGHSISLEANIEIPDEVDAVTLHGAAGIGLFRSEFFFLRAEAMPSEDDQYAAYAQVVKALPDQPVTIRTLDIGGDKILKNMNLQPINEKNPILGWRAIRFCLSHHGVFKTQLRAILRASVHGQVRIMFPLISGTEELDQALELLDVVRAELSQEGQAFDRHMPVGIMIEVPSAAMVTDVLAQKVDFFSIGTNDLIQYTVAVDRGNEHTAYLYNPLHLGVIRLLKLIIDNGHSHNRPVSMCGEMAGDPLYTFMLLGLGLDGFSMSAASIPEVKRIIRATTKRAAQDFVTQILACSSSSAIEDLVRRTMEERFEITYH